MKPMNDETTSYEKTYEHFNEAEKNIVLLCYTPLCLSQGCYAGQQIGNCAQSFR